MIETYFADELEKIAARLSVHELARAEARLAPVRLRGDAAHALGGISPTPSQARAWGSKPAPFEGMDVPAQIVDAFKRQVPAGKIGLSTRAHFAGNRFLFFGRRAGRTDTDAQRGLTLLHEAQERKVKNPTFNVPHASQRVLLDERRAVLAAEREGGALGRAGRMMKRMREASGEADLVRDKLRGIDPRLVAMYDEGALSGAARRFVDRKLATDNPISEEFRKKYEGGVRDFVTRNMMGRSG